MEIWYIPHGTHQRMRETLLIIYKVEYQLGLVMEILMTNNPYYDNPNHDKKLARMQLYFHANFYFDDKGLIRRKNDQRR